MDDGRNFKQNVTQVGATGTTFVSAKQDINFGVEGMALCTKVVSELNSEMQSPKSPLIGVKSQQYQPNIFRATADVTKPKRPSLGVETIRKATSQRSASNSRYSHQSSKLKGLREDRLAEMRGENSKVSPRQVAGLKSTSPRILSDLSIQNSKGTIGVRIKSGKKSEDGQFVTTNKDEKFVDKSFQGWDIKKQDVDTERQGEEPEEYRNEQNMYNDINLQQDPQNPLNKFYEQYGAQFGIRQSNESKQSELMQRQELILVNPSETMDIQEEVQKRQMQVIRETEEQLNKVSPQSNPQQPQPLDFNFQPSIGAQMEQDTVIQDYTQGEQQAYEMISLPDDTFMQAQPADSVGNVQHGAINIIDSIADAPEVAELPPQKLQDGPKIKIVNFLGREIVQEIPDPIHLGSITDGMDPASQYASVSGAPVGALFETSVESARRRFEKVAQNIDEDMLQYKCRVRKEKLDSIQQMLFHNKLQQDKGMFGSDGIIREAKFPSGKPSRPISSIAESKGVLSQTSVNSVKTGRTYRKGMSMKQNSQASERNRMYSTQTGMSVVLREPSEHIYVQERMPFIFQNEDITKRIGKMNSRAEKNLKEAASLNKNTGVLGKAKQLLQQRQRPSTGHHYSGSRGGLLDQEQNLEFKRVSLKNLDSTTGFKVAADSHGKMVANYLKQWTDGQAALPTDWFKQIENGRITNVQNIGLLVGRQLCKTCNRYRCSHTLFSGGVKEQQKLLMRNNAEGHPDQKPSKEMALEFTQNTGIENLQQPKLIGGQMQLTYKQKGDLPSGRGVSRVSNKTLLFFKVDQGQKQTIKPQNKYRRPKTNRLSRVASGDQSNNVQSFTNLRPRSRIMSATSGSNHSQSMQRKASWVSPHLRYKVDKLKVKEPLKFQLNIQQHYPYVNSDTIESAMPDPKTIGRSDAKSKNQQLVNSLTIQNNMSGKQQHFEAGSDIREIPCVQKIQESGVSQSADAQDMNDYYFDNIPGNAESHMENKFTSQAPPSAPKSAIQMMEEQVKEEKYRTQAIRESRKKGISSSHGSLQNYLTLKKESTQRSLEKSKATAIIISANQPPQSLYIGDIMQEEIQREQRKDGGDLSKNDEKYRGEKSTKKQRDTTPYASKELTKSSNVKDANWDQVHKIFDLKGGGPVRGSTSMADPGHSGTYKQPVTNADLNEVNDVDGHQSNRFNPLHSVHNVPDSSQSNTKGGTSQILISQQARPQTQHQAGAHSPAIGSGQFGVLNITGQPHQQVTLTAGPSVIQGALNDFKVGERNQNIVAQTTTNSVTSKKIIPIDEAIKKGGMTTIKSLQDFETNSRKNVVLTSANKLQENVNGGKEGIIIGMDNLNQFNHMADSPKIYGNENIISQPKLAGSVRSNMSDMNTTKVQEQDMQLMNLENSDYGPDSEYGKNNQKSHKSLTMISKRKAEIKVYNNQRGRKTSGMRLPITNPMPFGHDTSFSSNQMGSITNNMHIKNKNSIYKQDFSRHGSQKLGGGYLISSKPLDYQLISGNRNNRPKVQKGAKKQPPHMHQKTASMNFSNESSLMIQNQRTANSKVNTQKQSNAANNNPQVVFDENCNSTGTEEKLKDMLIPGESQTHDRKSMISSRTSQLAQQQRQRVPQEAVQASQGTALQPNHPYYNNQDLIGAISSTSSIKVLKIVNIQPPPAPHLRTSQFAKQGPLLGRQIGGKRRGLSGIVKK